MRKNIHTVVSSLLILMLIIGMFPIKAIAETTPAYMQNGKIVMSFYDKAASTGITYKTVGWMAHKDSVLSMAPPKGTRADFIGSAYKEVDSTNHGNGYVTTTFEVPSADILKYFASNTNLLDIEENQYFYLSSIFDVNKDNKKWKGSYYSYSEIVNAVGWGSQTKTDLKSYYNKGIAFKSENGGYPVILEIRVNGKYVSHSTVTSAIAGKVVTVTPPATKDFNGVTGTLNSTHWEYELRKGAVKDKIIVPAAGLTPRNVKAKVGGTRVVADYKVVPTVKVQHWDLTSNKLIEETTHQVTAADNSFSASMKTQAKPLQYLYSEISFNGGSTWGQRHTNATRNIIAGPGGNIIRFYYGLDASVIADLKITATPSAIKEGTTATVKFTLDASGSSAKKKIVKYAFLLDEDEEKLSGTGTSISESKTTISKNNVEPNSTWYGKVIVTDETGKTGEAYAEVEIGESAETVSLKVPYVRAKITGSIESPTTENGSHRSNADMTKYINRIEFRDNSRIIKTYSADELDKVQNFSLDEILGDYSKPQTPEEFKQKVQQELIALDEDISIIESVLDENGYIDIDKVSALVPQTFSGVDSPYERDTVYMDVILDFPEKVYQEDGTELNGAFFDDGWEWGMGFSMNIDGSQSSSDNGIGRYRITLGSREPFVPEKEGGFTPPSSGSDGSSSSYTFNNSSDHLNVDHGWLKGLFLQGWDDAGSYSFSLRTWDSAWPTMKSEVEAGNVIADLSWMGCSSQDLDPSKPGCQVIATENMFQSDIRLDVLITKDKSAMPTLKNPDVKLSINQQDFVIGETAEFKATFTEDVANTYPIDSKKWSIRSESGTFNTEGTGEIPTTYQVNLAPGKYTATQTIEWRDGEDIDQTKDANVLFEVFEVIKPNVKLTLNKRTGFAPDAIQKFVLPAAIGTFEVSFYEDARRTFPISGKGFKIWNEETGEVLEEKTIRKSDYPDLDIENPDNDNPIEIPSGWGDLSSGEMKPSKSLPYDIDGGIYRVSQTIYWIEDGKEYSQTEVVRFRLISPVPVAKFDVKMRIAQGESWRELILGKTAGKQYKEIQVDLTPSTQYNTDLENPYPIRYGSVNTQIKVIPLNPDATPNYGNLNKVVTFRAGDKVIEGNEIVIKGKQYISIRFDVAGKYRIQSRVANDYYTSKWVTKDIEIAEDLPPKVNITFEDVLTTSNISRYTTSRKDDLSVQFRVRTSVTMQDEDSPNYNSARLEMKYDRGGNNNPLDDGVHSQMLITKAVNGVQSYVNVLSKSTAMDFVEIRMYDGSIPVLGPILFEYSIGKTPVIPYFEGGDLPVINYPVGTTAYLSAGDKTVYVENSPGNVTVTMGKEGKVEVYIYLPNVAMANVSTSTVGFNVNELVAFYGEKAKIYVIDKDNVKKLLS